MYRASNSVIGLLNFIAFLFSIPILGGGLYLAGHIGTDCQRFLQWPVILMGAFIMVLSLAGFVGACYRVSWLLWLYLFLMFFVILLLLFFIIFAFGVTSEGRGRAVPGREYNEYRLGDYSSWLQNRVKNPENWRKIKNCIIHANVCPKLAAAHTYLSPIQSGCCKPPSSCGYAYVNATYWIWNGVTVSSVDPDCNAWGNEQTQLCYDCNSCKAGVLENLKREWRKVSPVSIVLLIFLIVVYTIGCSAFRNSRKTDTDYSHGRNMMTKMNPTSLW